MMTAGSTSTPYIPRTPADTPCYKIVQDNLATFLAEREAANRPLPKYVVDEFDSYLRCGLFPFGFLRIKCLDCGDETQVPFSCKGRVVCASCASKRMVESAAHLVDNVLPLLPYRQFVVTFPIPLRYWMQSNNGLFSKIHGLVIRAINRYYIEKAKKDGTDNPAPGSISFTQRWGSALNVDPHLHILCPDGVYFRENGAPRFHFLDPISEKEVAHLLESISQSVLRYLRKKKYIDADGKVVDLPPADKMFQDNESIAMATEASVGGRIAFGPNAGKRVTRIASGFGYQEEIPVGKGKRCYSINGFSLHANRSTNTLQREELETLIQYMARGPFSNERLEYTDKGGVKLRLKSPWTDGTTHVMFTATEFLEKLAALVPPRRAHLVRWGGVFAPNSPYRKEITLRPEIKKGTSRKNDADGIDSESPALVKN